MNTDETLKTLRTLILSDYTFLYLTTWEEQRWESQLANLALDIGQGLVTWTITGGPQPPLGQAGGLGDGQTAADEAVTQADGPPGAVAAASAASGWRDTRGASARDLERVLDFLAQVLNYPRDHVFLLKDFHPYLSNPMVVRKLRDLADVLPEQGKTLIFFGPVLVLPPELEKDVVCLDLPLPDVDDLRPVLAGVLRQHARPEGAALELSEDEQERMLKAVLGLTEREARKAMLKALHGQRKMQSEVYRTLVGEKRRLIRGSDLLEFYDLDEGIQDIGGLHNLKAWLASRAEAFSERARRHNLPMPKGALLLGIQGCGKSLTARAAAKLLSFPLLRMDVAGLLSGERGSSEKNMREALKIVESIAPAVLWLDEIEKGFAGLEGADAARDGTMARIFGTFLTWMQDRAKPVFVVATANSVASLPPELLRRGRFDELFFIDLPNYHERKDIFRIHLAKRSWKPEKYDVEGLATRTEGYSGAEIEQIVISAMYEAYGAGRKLTQQDLLEARDQTVPLSVTMEERVFQLREWARNRCRPATPDSRVIQMLEEEDRRAQESPAR
ncbi:MAG: AAA family ATPase [Planctomycetes bacterium]|nr:AAA family ATPase [Planctomycetota bacterium]